MFASFLGGIFLVHRQKFAINLVNFCLILGWVFYATLANVCHKFGECLSHFWEGFFMLHRQKFALKLGNFCLIFGRFFCATQAKKF